jgi:hypothetical protein
MRFFPVIAAVVLTVFGSGFASRVSQADEADSADRSKQAVSERVKLTELAGQWSGVNRLWVYPGDPVRESETKASVEFAARGALAMITYTWAYEGGPQEGILMVRTETDADDVEVVWVDSWHTSSKFMLFRGEEDKEGLVAVHGTYSAPGGPDWGWRIVLGADSADEIHILMYNITPDGQEALAVEARYVRAETA